MRVSLICTVLNEGESIGRLLDSLVAQTRRPDEVIVVDGGSSDGTADIIRSYADLLPVRVLVEPGANISRGRNLAIAAAVGEIIAATDAGVWLEPNWLAELVSPFAEGGGAPQVVAGFFLPDTLGAFEAAMGATVLPTAAEINPTTFLPSSRSVAYLKSAWQAAGGYPEWLDYCEDLILDLKLREVAGPFAWAPLAIAHFRPRGTWRSYWRQYYRYARGDGKADLWRRRHAIRYVTYLMVIPALLLLSVFHSPWWLAVLLAGVVAYCRTPWRRLVGQWGGLTLIQRGIAFALVPAIRLVGDVAKMAGYPAGWVWRLGQRKNPEVHWRKAPERSAA